MDRRLFLKSRRVPFALRLHITFSMKSACATSVPFILLSVNSLFSGTGKTQAVFLSLRKPQPDSLHCEMHNLFPCTLKGSASSLHKKAPEGRSLRSFILLYCFSHTRFTARHRIAFSTQRTITPTSAKIASHMFAIPSAPSSRQISFTPIAK